MSGHGTLPSRADDVCWQLTHYHHRHVIQKAAYSQNATGENNQIAEQCVLEGSTIWWFAAFLFLLGFSTPDIIVKSTGGPATPPVPFAPSSSTQLPALSSTLRILYRVAERFHESFAEGGWNFHVIPVVPGH
jgi:hypothetical protein